ncbi:MAG: protease pro-enzyme activation domain-containing protein [Terracidiphilus sp.]|nr:protease pro-enzyme activation domain-containing protein [Terracidiphilus sp.]
MSNLRSLCLSVLAGLLLATANLSSQQTAAPLNRVVSPVSDQQLVTLKGTVHPLANMRNDRGSAPESMQLDRLRLYLKRSTSQEADLKTLIAEQHTPGSANYHKWLTPEEFGKRFGPSDQDIAAVESWLAGHGFNVTKVNPGRLTMEVSGSVAQMSSTFHTQIHRYEVNGETHYANANNPQIPEALAPVVGGFVSLNNFRPRSYSRTLGKASYDPATHQATPQWTYGSSSVNFVLAPADYAVQYDLTPLYNKGINGTGQTIAIVNESNINVAQVNQFRSLFGLPYNPPQVIVDGNDPGIDGSNNPDGPNGASVEAYLDVEWAGAVAPNATIALVIAGNTALSNGLELAAERAVFSNIASVISVSFGSCESNLGTENAVLSQLWEQAAAQGITVLVSSGDAGSAGCDNDSTQEYAVSGQAVNGWASTPYNVAVGGTDFYYSNYASTSALNSQLATYWNTTATQLPATSLQKPIPEQPWNDSQFGLNAYNLYTNNGTTSIASGGGGASNCALGTYDSNGNTTSCSGGYPKPAWQTLTIGGTQYVPGDGVRDVPDVSLFAADGLNFSYYPACAADGDCQSPAGSNLVQLTGVGGTSASTPAFAGIMALVNQQTGARQGQANTILYPMKAQFPSAFHDVTNGTNSVPCEYAPTKTASCIAAPSSNTVVLGSVTEGQIGSGTTPRYSAGAGYNLATGLGTIDAYNLVTNWSSVKLTPTTTTLALNPLKTTYNHGDSITFSGTVAQSSGSGTPAGNVALMTDSSEQAQQGQNVFTLSGGTYSQAVTTLPGGTYNVWASYGGDSANAASTSAKTKITVNAETSAIDLYGFSGNTYLPVSSSNSATVEYGTQLILSALVAPSGQTTALQNCILNGSGCASLHFTMPTGTVTFTDSGSTVLNVASINAQGDAEYNAPFAVGTHSVTAGYPGDSSYNSTTSSGALKFTVVQDTPQISINASALNNAGQVVVGTNQAATVSIQVQNYVQANASSASPVAVAAPTGTVTVSGFPSGVPTSVTLSAATDPGLTAVEGVGNLSLPASTASGTYKVTFTYNGDSNYAKSSTTVSIPVLNNATGTTTTTAATTTGSISPTSTITVSGTVTGQNGSGAPTGSVIVYSSGFTDNSNGNQLGNVALSATSNYVSSFSFTLNSATLTQGANFITLQYTGDTTYAPSATVLGSGSGIANPLSDFTLIPATTNLPVSAGSNANDVIQLGSVNGFNGTVNLTCTAAAGVSCAINNTAGGSTAGLSSNGSTTATLTVTAPSQTANQTYNVLVNAADAATGKYIHTLGINAVVTGSSAGSKSFALSAGTTSLSLDASASINNSGTSAITVTPLGGYTGSVALSCAVSPAGSASPSCGIASQATLGSAQTTALTVTTNASTAAGSYTVTVTGTSGTITMTTPVAVSVGAANFAVSNSGNLTVSSKGTAVTGTITVAPSNGFTGTVSLNCVVTGPNGANAPATCSIPASVSITSTSAQTATLTIYTTAATAMNKPANLFWPETGGTVLALVALFGIGRKRRNWLAMLLGVLLLIVSTSVVGCGGSGGGNSGGGSSSNPGTTSGTYTATVTATTGSGASAITKTTAVTVTVN